MAVRSQRAIDGASGELAVRIGDTPERERFQNLRNRDGRHAGFAGGRQQRMDEPGMPEPVSYTHLDVYKRQPLGREDEIPALRPCHAEENLQ